MDFTWIQEETKTALCEKFLDVKKKKESEREKGEREIGSTVCFPMKFSIFSLAKEA